MAAGSILVDTSTIIDHLRKKNKKKSSLYKIIDKYDLFISTITLYELFAGAINEQKRKDISDFIILADLLPFTVEAAERAGSIYLSLRNKNEIIDVIDILIGATALTNNLPIVTLNKKHFERIAGLKIL